MEDFTDKSILANIKAIRNIKGYSQEYVASKLSLKQSGYGFIEGGIRKLSVINLLQIAVIFDMSVIELIGFPNKYVKQEEIGINPLAEQLEFKNEQLQFYKEKIAMLEQKLEEQVHEKKHPTSIK